ncbi:sensor histidine kinase [Paenibacillus antri]|uniref:histidine kinase n=1 Tax=Paenibacillus antri TaxID=2582848 RepID=A0A5R9GD63_9BACL|nr:sensor histidine kinase [Paenibacillus antri]TLS49325.1 sensor histidine kinase [Paenibacillus antri]
MKHIQRIFTLTQHVGWWYIAAISIAVFLFSAWKSYELYLTPCAASACGNLFQLTFKEAADLNSFGMSTHLYGAIVTILITIQFITFFSIGALLYYYGFKDRVCLFASILLIATGTALGIQPEVFQGSPDMNALLQIVNFTGGLYLFFLFLYPDGHFAPGWLRVPAYFGLVGTIGQYFLQGTLIDPNTWPAVFRTSAFLTLHVLIVYSQARRYRNATTVEQKRQIKWFVASLGSFLIAVPVSLLLQSLDHGLAKMLTWFVFYTGLLFMPFSIGISIFELRLRNMSILFNRTIIYVFMTVFVISTYVIVVGLFGAVLQSNGNVFVSLLATGMAAVLFQPIRSAVQRGVNRLVYGDREEPYTVLSRLTERVELTLTHSSLMQTVVEGLAQALRIPYASIEIEQDGRRIALASHGVAGETASELPLQIQGEKVGVLRLGVRSWRETLPPAKYYLLDDLIRHAGIAVQAVRLQGELQRSRERLVTAREEERRRLRRDLHDGLGVELASIAHKIDGLLYKQQADDETAGKLSDIQEHLRQTISSLRRLVYALRPPALDEFGFAFAVREIAYQFADHPLRVTVETMEELPALPAAVEVAGYRIIQEAVANAIRHSRGSKCEITVRADSHLHIAIKDDGHGFPSNPKAGVGQQSMRERAEEVGGRLSVTSVQGAGTTVAVTIPIWKEGESVRGERQSYA